MVVMGWGSRRVLLPRRRVGSRSVQACAQAVALTVLLSLFVRMAPP